MILFIVHSKKSYRKMCFSLCTKLYIDLWSFLVVLLMSFVVWFWLKLMFFSFKYPLNFRVLYLKSKLDKVWYTKFVKFRLESMSSQIERAFKKKRIFFLSSFCQLYFYCNFFWHFPLILKFIFFISSIFTKFMGWTPF